MVLVAGHALVSASAPKVNDDDLTFRGVALQIGGVGQKRCTEAQSLRRSWSGTCRPQLNT